MKGLIIYTSQYGSTKQYASWLSEELELPIVDLERVVEEEIWDAEFLIIGSNVKIGTYKAAAWIKEHWSWLKNKKLLLYSVSMSFADPQEQKKILENSFDKEILGAFEYYALPGRLEKDKLNTWDRIIVFLGSKILPEGDEKQKMKEGFDFVDEEKLSLLIEAVDNLTGEVRIKHNIRS